MKARWVFFSSCHKRKHRQVLLAILQVIWPGNLLIVSQQECVSRKYFSRELKIKNLALRKESIAEKKHDMTVPHWKDKKYFSIFTKVSKDTLEMDLIGKGQIKAKQRLES